LTRCYTPDNFQHLESQGRPISLAVGPALSSLLSDRASNKHYLHNPCRPAATLLLARSIALPLPMSLTACSCIAANPLVAYLWEKDDLVPQQPEEVVVFKVLSGGSVCCWTRHYVPSQGVPACQPCVVKDTRTCIHSNRIRCATHAHMQRCQNSHMSQDTSITHGGRACELPEKP
jgi:hypothetical protein